jgi:lipoprotein-anchoring transpeptidase ErfK/SrfK
MPSVNATGRNPVATTSSASAAPTSAAGLKNVRFAGVQTFEQIAKGELTLTAGAKGDTVKRLQNALLDMGFSLRPYKSARTGQMVGGVDGAWGNQTATALANFQRHAANFFPEVKPNGKLDAATLKALDALAPAPGTKAWAPGQQPKTPAPFFNGQQVRVVVVKDEHRTYLFDKQGKIAGIFSNSVGAAGSTTDTGLKVVASKLGKAEAEAAGKSLWNAPRAFGDRILNLSWADGSRSGEELHGTYAYDQMGMDVSHGCVRHYNEDIVRIFDSLAVGEKVAVVDSLSDKRLAAPRS